MPPPDGTLARAKDHPRQSSQQGMNMLPTASQCAIISDPTPSTSGISPTDTPVLWLKMNMNKSRLQAARFVCHQRVQHPFIYKLSCISCSNLFMNAVVLNCGCRMCYLCAMLEREKGLFECRRCKQVIGSHTLLRDVPLDEYIRLLRLDQLGCHDRISRDLLATAKLAYPNTINVHGLMHYYDCLPRCSYEQSTAFLMHVEYTRVREPNRKYVYDFTKEEKTAFDQCFLGKPGARMPVPRFPRPVEQLQGIQERMQLMARERLCAVNSNTKPSLFGSKERLLVNLHADLTVRNSFIPNSQLPLIQLNVSQNIAAENLARVVRKHIACKFGLQSSRTIDVQVFPVVKIYRAGETIVEASDRTKMSNMSKELCKLKERMLIPFRQYAQEVMKSAQGSMAEPAARLVRKKCLVRMLEGVKHDKFSPTLSVTEVDDNVRAQRGRDSIRAFHNEFSMYKDKHSLRQITNKGEIDFIRAWKATQEEITCDTGGPDHALKEGLKSMNLTRDEKKKLLEESKANRTSVDNDDKVEGTMRMLKEFFIAAMVVKDRGDLRRTEAVTGVEAPFKQSGAPESLRRFVRESNKISSRYLLAAAVENGSRKKVTTADDLILLEDPSRIETSRELGRRQRESFKEQKAGLKKADLEDIRSERTEDFVKDCKPSTSRAVEEEGVREEEEKRAAQLLTKIRAQLATEAAPPPKNMQHTSLDEQKLKRRPPLSKSAAYQYLKAKLPGASPCPNNVEQSGSDPAPHTAAPLQNPTTNSGKISLNCPVPINRTPSSGPAPVRPPLRLRTFGKLNIPPSNKPSTNVHPPSSQNGAHAEQCSQSLPSDAISNTGHEHSLANDSVDAPLANSSIKPQQSPTACSSSQAHPDSAESPKTAELPHLIQGFNPEIQRILAATGGRIIVKECANPIPLGVKLQPISPPPPSQPSNATPSAPPQQRRAPPLPMTRVRRALRRALHSQEGETVGDVARRMVMNRGMERRRTAVTKSTARRRIITPTASEERTEKKERFRVALIQRVEKIKMRRMVDKGVIGRKRERLKCLHGKRNGLEKCQDKNTEEEAAAGDGQHKDKTIENRTKRVKTNKKNLCPHNKPQPLRRIVKEIPEEAKNLLRRQEGPLLILAHPRTPLSRFGHIIGLRVTTSHDVHLKSTTETKKEQSGDVYISKLLIHLSVEEKKTLVEKYGLHEVATKATHRTTKQGKNIMQFVTIGTKDAKRVTIDCPSKPDPSAKGRTYRTPTGCKQLVKTYWTRRENGSIVKVQQQLSIWPDIKRNIKSELAMSNSVVTTSSKEKAKIAKRTTVFGRLKNAKFVGDRTLKELLRNREEEASVHLLYIIRDRKMKVPRQKLSKRRRISNDLERTGVERKKNGEKENNEGTERRRMKKNERSKSVKKNIHFDIQKSAKATLYSRAIVAAKRTTTTIRKNYFEQVMNGVVKAQETRKQDLVDAIQFAQAVHRWFLYQRELIFIMHLIKRNILPKDWKPSEMPPVPDLRSVHMSPLQQHTIYMLLGERVTVHLLKKYEDFMKTSSFEHQNQRSLSLNDFKSFVRRAKNRPKKVAKRSQMYYDNKYVKLHAPELRIAKALWAERRAELSGVAQDAEHLNFRMTRKLRQLLLHLYRLREFDEREWKGLALADPAEPIKPRMSIMSNEAKETAPQSTPLDKCEYRSILHNAAIIKLLELAKMMKNDKNPESVAQAVERARKEYPDRRATMARRYVLSFKKKKRSMSWKSAKMKNMRQQNKGKRPTRAHAARSLVVEGRKNFISHFIRLTEKQKRTFVNLFQDRFGIKHLRWMAKFEDVDRETAEMNRPPAKEEEEEREKEMQTKKMRKRPRRKRSEIAACPLPTLRYHSSDVQSL